MVPGDSNVIQTCPSGQETLSALRELVDRDGDDGSAASGIVLMMKAGRSRYFDRDYY